MMVGLNSKKIIGAVVLLALVAGIVLYISKPTPEPAPQAMPIAEEKKTEPVHEIIGTSVEGRNIDAYTYGDGTTRLLFVGGIHGGYEWNSVVHSDAYTALD